MCPRFKPRERGRRKTLDGLPTVRFRNEELATSAAVELLAPDLQLSSPVCYCLTDGPLVLGRPHLSFDTTLKHCQLPQIK